MKSFFKREIGVMLALLFCAVLAATVGTLFHFLLFERPYLSYKNLPFPALQVTARAGEVMPLKVERCSSSSRMQIYTTSHSLRRVPDNRFFMLPDVQIMIMPGCTIGISYLNRLPDNLPPGTYELFGTAEVRGLIKTHVVDWHSQPFQVVSP